MSARTPVALLVIAAVLALLAAVSATIAHWVLESKINFLNGVPKGARLEAVARPVEKKRTIGLWNVEIRSAGDGLLVATCQGMTYHKA